MSKISTAEIKDLNKWFNEQQKEKGFIDMENRVIKGKSGELYKIAPEAITAGRWSEYQVQTIQLSFSATFQNVIVKIGRAMTSLRNTQGFGGVIDSAKILEEVIDGLKRIDQATAPDIIKYCSLFCIRKGEDCSKYDPIVVQEKFEDWSHIAVYDFFLLAVEQVPYLSDLSKNMQRGFKLEEVLTEIQKSTNQKDK